jgi:hypothetical protein
MSAASLGCHPTEPATPAISTLAVGSMGRLGLDTQIGVGNLQSNIFGALTSLVVKGDIKEAFINVTGVDAADGKVGGVTIGGSLIGGSNAASGGIGCSGDLGPVKIGHDLRGGSALGAGLISTKGKLAGLDRVRHGDGLLHGGDRGVHDPNIDRGVLRNRLRRKLPPTWTTCRPSEGRGASRRFRRCTLPTSSIALPCFPLDAVLSCCAT